MLRISIDYFFFTMSSFKTSIYCGNVTPSKEHLFPVKGGGLKKDSRILCAVCNGNFGLTLDDAFARQFNHFLYTIFYP